jgi:hypothetical protein
VVGLEAFEERREACPGELPVEGLRDLVVVALEVVERARRRRCRRSRWIEQLTLDDRVVDLGLVELS